MKKLLAILAVFLFANQASALDVDEWVGFECSRYDPNKKEYIYNLPFPDFVAVNYNIYRKRINSNGTYYSNCDDRTFTLYCEDSIGYSIEIHEYTTRVTEKIIGLTNYYQCNLVEKRYWQIKLG